MERENRKKSVQMGLWEAAHREVVEETDPAAEFLVHMLPSVSNSIQRMSQVAAQRLDVKTQVTESCDFVAELREERSREQDNSRESRVILRVIDDTADRRKSRI